MNNCVGAANLSKSPRVFYNCYSILLLFAYIIFLLLLYRTFYFVSLLYMDMCCVLLISLWLELFLLFR